MLARELGRDLRLKHSADVFDNLEGLEIAQRYLRERVGDGRTRGRDEDREILRNGAFVSELLARGLGAKWSDLGSEDPARWAMAVPTARKDEIVRVWPFARVARFVAMGHKERDLFSYYLELEARSR